MSSNDRYCPYCGSNKNITIRAGDVKFKYFCNSCNAEMNYLHTYEEFMKERRISEEDYYYRHPWIDD